MTFQTVLTLTALYDWDIAILDVKTAFLYWDLKEDIYMDLPAGFFSLDENISEVTNTSKNKLETRQANRKVCLKLNHALYSLVQVARSWWLKFVNALVNVGFEQGEVNPCLIFRKNECSILILILYVDDCLLTGDALAIESGINDIKNV